MSQYKYDPYFGVVELKNDRRWTPAMTTQFIGEPDHSRPDLGGRNAPRVKLWWLTCVKDIAATATFQQRWWKASERRTVQQRSGPQDAEDTERGTPSKGLLRLSNTRCAVFAPEPGEAEQRLPAAVHTT